MKQKPINNKNFISLATITACLLLVFVFSPNQTKAFDSADCDSGDLSTTCTITTTKTLPDGETITGNNLIIDSGGNLTTAFNSTTHAYNSFIINLSGDLTLQNGGTITGNTDITATNLTIDGTSSIDVSGKGYAGGEYVDGVHEDGHGPGAGTYNVTGGGAGYGGNGGNGGLQDGNYGLGGSAYDQDKISNPTSLGSGGGVGFWSGPGGNGGGVL